MSGVQSHGLTLTSAASVESFVFQPLNRRDVVGKFDGGTITSDAGALLLREVDRVTSIIQKFAACFTDFRNHDLIEHELTELIAQRIYGLALGYEDLNDHDEVPNSHNGWTSAHGGVGYTTSVPSQRDSAIEVKSYNGRLVHEEYNTLRRP